MISISNQSLAYELERIKDDMSGAILILDKGNKKLAKIKLETAIRYLEIFQRLLDESMDEKTVDISPEDLRKALNVDEGNDFY